MRSERLLNDVVGRLESALDERLVSLVLYGPGAQNETGREVGCLNLLIVASELTPNTLESLGPSVRWWLAKDKPWPRLFTPSLIRDSLDIYPIEFLDIARRHRILRGQNLVADLEVDTNHLRLQCERELREKLMRLREGYVECGRTARPLHRLLAASYTSFAPLWSACLHLLGSEVPARDSDVFNCLCQWLELDGEAIDEVGLIADGARTKQPEALFERYLDELTKAVERIDRLVVERKGDSR